MAKKKAFVIQWSEWEVIPSCFGHGVEFHIDSHPKEFPPVAFLDGYEWYHGKSKVVQISIRKADDQCSAGFLIEAKKQIGDSLKSGTLMHGHLGGQLYAWFNS